MHLNSCKKKINKQKKLAQPLHQAVYTLALGKKISLIGALLQITLVSAQHIPRHKCRIETHLSAKTNIMPNLDIRLQHKQTICVSYHKIKEDKDRPLQLRLYFSSVFAKIHNRKVLCF